MYSFSKVVLPLFLLLLNRPLLLPRWVERPRCFLNCLPMVRCGAQAARIDSWWSWKCGSLIQNESTGAKTVGVRDKRCYYHCLEMAGGLRGLSPPILAQKSKLRMFWKAIYLLSTIRSKDNNYNNWKVAVTQCAFNDSMNSQNGSGL